MSYKIYHFYVLPVNNNFFFLEEIFTRKWLLDRPSRFNVTPRSRWMSSRTQQETCQRRKKKRI